MPKKISHFFAYLSRMKLIARWSLMRNTESENIQEHSLQVAMIAHALAVIKNKLYGGNVDPERITLLAAYHDVQEIITGDLPTPVKYYNPNIRDEFKKVEDIASKHLFDMIPGELQDEFHSLFFKHDKDDENWKIVKAADKITSYLKCLEELKAGNNEFKSPAEGNLKQLEEIMTPEIQYFMKHFVPSFSMTLYELH